MSRVPDGCALKPISESQQQQSLGHRERQTTERRARDTSSGASRTHWSKHHTPLRGPGGLGVLSGSNHACRGCKDNTSPYADTRDFFLAAHATCDYTFGSPLVMSLLNVPSIPFLPVFSQSTTTPTPLTGIRLNPCATLLWGGLSGHLADPIPNTGYEPKFCIDVSSERTPVNLPTRNTDFQQEYDATIAASEDIGLPRHSGVSRSSQHTAASTVPTLLKLGS